jgi:hypothetical protein
MITSAESGTKKRKASLKRSDMIIFGIILVVIVVLGVTLMNKLQLKSDVNHARTISDQVVADIDKRDGEAARKLGNKKFQDSYTAKQLTDQFKTIQLATDKKPTIIQQTVGGEKGKKVVYMFYQYPPKLANKSFFIRVAVTQNGDKWQLTSISGSADAASLGVH